MLPVSHSIPSLNTKSLVSGIVSYGYSLFVVGDGQVVVTALRSSLPQVR
jgi:hypothetical protein